MLVLNQFALPRNQGGGTRHIDLFSRLETWAPKILAGSRNNYSQASIESDDDRFDLVKIPRHNNTKSSRVFAWLTYSVGAFTKGLTEDADIVYASSPHLLTPLVGLALARLKRIPFVLEVRDLWPESIVSAGLIAEQSSIHRLLSQLEVRLYDSADAIVGVTEGWAGYFQERGLVDKLTIIPNGADLADFEVTEDRNDLRGQYGFTRTTAVFAGAHGPKDGLDLILDAARHVKDVDFVLVGAGAAKAAAMERAVNEGLKNVRFFAPVSKEQLPKLLNAADMGIHAVTPLPVFERGMSPNKLFDYLAAGLPVASNARGALTAVAGDAEVGIFGEVHDLGSCIRKIANSDVEARDRWRAAGLALIERKFSRTLASARLEYLLTTVADRANPVRIAHITTVHSAQDGRIFYKECRALAEAGFDIHLVAPQIGNSHDAGVRVHGVRTGRNRLQRCLLGQVDMWRAIKQIGPTVVHVHDPELIPLALSWKLMRGGRVVYDAHEDLVAQIAGKSYIPIPFRSVAKRAGGGLISLADRHADAVVAATPVVAGSFGRQDVVVVRNFPWLKTFPRAKGKERAGIRRGAVFVGAVTKHRMIDTMLEAAERVPGCTLRIAGPADAYSEVALSRAAPNGSVRYLGRLAPPEIPQLLATSQVGLILLAPLGNYRESLPTKMFEYMAAGIPFIASNFPYWREMLADHDCGVFVDPEDAHQVAQQLERLLKDPEECARLGSNGRRAFEESFSFDQDAGKLVGLVEDLVSSSRGSRPNLGAVALPDPGSKQ